MAIVSQIWTRLRCIQTGNQVNDYQVLVSFFITPIISSEPESVLGSLDISEEIKNDLLAAIKRRLTPQAMRIRADIEVTCYGYEGIDAIKQALLAGEGCKDESADIKIKLVAPPLYVLVTNCMDKQHGLDTLDKAILTIEEVIKKFKGNMAIKMKASTQFVVFYFY